MNLSDLLLQATRAGRYIADDARTDGHEETPALCLDLWLDSVIEDEAFAAFEALTVEDRQRVRTAFLDAAEGRP